jgi:uncharacterized protein (DUF488 family)
MTEPAIIEETTTARAPIHTIGYGGRPIDEFVACLRSFDIAMLVDVRSQPYSRYHPDYQRDNLTRRLEAEGIGYRWMGAKLGGRPVQAVCYVDGHIDYQLVRAQDFFRDGLAALRALADEAPRLSIMCAEKKPESCHRMRLVGAALDAAGVEVIHIDGPGNSRPHAKVAASAAGPQLDLFATQP